MRLDLFLKASRLCLRRTIAQNLCDAGLVWLNGVPAKSAHTVKSGDEITIKRRDKITRIKVLVVPSERQTSKKDAVTLYEVIDELTEPKDLLV
jgi:ribosomal 50S subunit-recycling heat shock protein